jgi:hypothetical protein
MKIKKIVLLSLLAIVIIVIVFFGYIILTTKSHSPADRMEFSDGEFELTIDYCRPFKKERLIFGDASDGALLPYGKYWRTGANEATEIEFNRDININGEKLIAGRYRFYTIPDKNTWTIAFNSELGKWGYGEPDYDLDILRIEVPVEILPQSIEQFTIIGEQSGNRRMNIVLHWEITQVSIPVSY